MIELDKKELAKLFFNEVCGTPWIKAYNGGMYLPIYYRISDNNTNLENVKKEKLPESKDNSVDDVVINITDYQLFQQKLFEYVKKFIESKLRWTNHWEAETQLDDIKTAFVSLFTNATWQDYENPIDLIDRYISFLDRDYLHELLKGGKEIFAEDGSTLRIRTGLNDAEMETPYKFIVEATDNIRRKEFPAVHYGIHKKEAYIYAVQGTNHTTDLQGKYQRNDYENEMIQEMRQKIRQEGKKDDYRGAEPLAIVSLICFLETLKESGIHRVNLPNILPLRYNSKDKLYGTEKSDEVQNAATNRLLLQVRRIMHYHTEGIKLLSVPGESGDFLSIDITDYKPKGEKVETICKNIDGILFQLNKGDEER